ncbi:MAG: biopolymer transporter ExbD [Deltaproteobacteria bacterium]|nr:biopolymer transporter ExbD [Deltaproteobacteria bacterium]
MADPGNNPYASVGGGVATAGGVTTPPTDKLTAAQRSKIRRLSQPKEIAPDEEAGELNIVPFLDIITNVLMFVLASISVTFTISLLADAPKQGKGGVAKIQEESLNLTVIIASDGYFIKGRAASIAEGCNGIGGGRPTVPRLPAGPTESFDGKKYDIAALQKCARKLKEEVTNADAEQQVMVTANPNVPFQEIVRVMDAVRKDDKGELFPNVVFTVLK